MASARSTSCILGVRLPKCVLRSWLQVLCARCRACISSVVRFMLFLFFNSNLVSLDFHSCCCSNLLPSFFHFFAPTGQRRSVHLDTVFIIWVTMMRTRPGCRLRRTFRPLRACRAAQEARTVTQNAGHAALSTRMSSSSVDDCSAVPPQALRRPLIGSSPSPVRRAADAAGCHVVREREMGVLRASEVF